MNSRIGRKLLLSIIICMVLTVLVVNIFTVHLSGNSNDQLMKTQTATGMNTLVAAKETQLSRIADVLSDMEYSGLLRSDAPAEELNAFFASKKKTESDFAAVMDPNGNIVWKTDNFRLADFSLASARTGYTGVVSDSNSGLALQSAMTTDDGGAAVSGMYLTETSWIDDVKEQSSAEITIIDGSTRIATTIINGGQRAVGTEIAASTSQTLNGGNTVESTIDILGQNHYVFYRPMYDINNKVVGAYFAGFSAAESEELKVQLILVSTIIAVVVGGIMLVVIGFYAIKTILRPIQEAEKLADSMSRGALNEPNSDYKFGNDELGDFVRKLEFTKKELNSYVADINDVLSQMATGDFTVKPKVKYLGDFIQISESFEQIESALNEIIGNIAQSSKDVKNGSDQIAEGSQVLADGTTRQAAAIEELSASINEIANKVQQSAHNASEASNVSVQSAEKITRQDNEVKNMLAAMEEIKEKSDQIQNIIKAIDDIAFQTNILALNAAIEAARAGAAGKGFAVVADEVRNLAAKSAESAAQTGELINATIAAVDKGTVIAQSTAEIMKEVTELADRTNSYIGEISTAADDQADSIEQIKIGIDQISTVVQQNSATAEQTAASCEELSGQSAMLEEQIEKLKV
ncbi:MAG: methyl-accepting chemotaxis protein [Ruminococcaceae bacterium]|nr:methyl-accepting chemotaxis protein [Oscillospiraceae bacterium]